MVFLAKEKRYPPPRFQPLKPLDTLYKGDLCNERRTSPEPQFRREKSMNLKPRFGSFSLTTCKCNKRCMELGRTRENHFGERNRCKRVMDRCFETDPKIESHLGSRRKSELDFNNYKYREEKSDLKNAHQCPRFRRSGRRVTFEGLERRPYLLEQLRNSRNNSYSLYSR